MKHILIIQTAFIGDVVLALPVAQRLKETFPQATIHFLLRKGNENLLENHPAIDKVWIWNKKTNKMKNLFQLYRTLSGISFDLIINLQRFFSMGLLTSVLHGKQKIGFKENPCSFFYHNSNPHIRGNKESKEWLHEVDRNLGLLNHICETHRERPKLYPSVLDNTAILPYTEKPYVVLAPASVWATKQWPLKHWRTLIEKIPSSIQVWVVGGPSDADMIEELIQGISYAGNLAGKLTFLQTSALMKKSIRVIANDSAPLHFASAVNAPCTALFCSTIPQFGFGPLSDDCVVLEIEEPLSCRPCGLHGRKKCPEGHFLCGFEISPESVLQTIIYGRK